MYFVTFYVLTHECAILLKTCIYTIRPSNCKVKKVLLSMVVKKNFMQRAKENKTPKDPQFSSENFFPGDLIILVNILLFQKYLLINQLK